MAIQFGCATLGTATTYGAVNRASQKTDAEIATASNALGNVTNAQAYSRKTTGSVRVVYWTDGTGIPEVGVAAAVAGVSGLCTSVNHEETNTGYRMCDLESVLHDSATIGALA
jgi:endonuclease YncB( thermonuclease family)